MIKKLELVIKTHSWFLKDQDSFTYHWVVGNVAPGFSLQVQDLASLVISCPVVSPAGENSLTSIIPGEERSCRRVPSRVQ